MVDREEELNTIVQRLKDQLAQREKLPEPEVVESRKTCLFHPSKA